MKRERTMLEVIVDLDPMPGTMHTAESAVQSVQAVLLGAMGHYNPVAMVATPTDVSRGRAVAVRQLGEVTAERDDLAETLRLRSEALNRVAAENDRLRATRARVEELTRGPLSDGYRPYGVQVGREVHMAVLLDDLRAALADPAETGR